ncbi:hypothetical protein [Pseudomonas vranovensis]|uniref:hypothetical protein n=1 Tax=Pseudomonas vranovensis TaxID=321661 RepID=UPI00160BBBE7|nr:hypothetical protein [Pseudomonas vranovensis]
MDSRSDEYAGLDSQSLNYTAPVLPSAVRYYDDFQDKYNSINNLSQDEWKAELEGKKSR